VDQAAGCRPLLCAELAICLSAELTQEHEPHQHMPLLRYPLAVAPGHAHAERSQEDCSGTQALSFDDFTMQ